MNSEEVSLPLIHEHPMMPWNDMRKGDCCGSLETISDGFYCKSCDFFVHKKCGESSEYIEHPCHSMHTLKLVSKPNNLCDLCGKSIDVNLCYRCEICDFDVDLYCIKYPPPEVIEISESHHHKLTLLEDLIEFDCDAKCGKIGYGFPYKCNECEEVLFHVDCVWNQPKAKHELEINHSHHSLHPLKLLTGSLPDYSDGRCRLCAREIEDKLFYHCSSCNFSLDMRCVLNPPPKSVMDLKAHDHQLTLLSRLISFTCNACGLNGDRSPYVCFQCDFMIHQDCLDLPRVIKVNRHDHNVSRTSVLGVVNSVCGVCRKKVDWTCGGYSCQKCPQYVIHSKCATRRDVWNGKDLEEVPEETEDKDLYVPIDDSTIQHFSHKEHYLRLHVNGVLWEEENKRCRACTHPIGLQSFYDCVDCDFILHQTCAGFPRRIWHVLSNKPLTLVTSEANMFKCYACHNMSNGFRYQGADMVLDVLCGTISEPFVHPSHHHLLFYIPQDGRRQCSGCNELASPVLMCVEEGCYFVLDFKCATLPLMVKHSIDDDHPFSLCFGKEASGKHWCDICGKQTDVQTWFYTRKDQQDSLHTNCVVGDFSRLMPTSRIEHFSHKEHYLRFHVNDVLWEEENKRCRACTHPIGFQSFYGCIDCDFFLHLTCAGIPRKIWHVVSNEQLTLVTSEANMFECSACLRMSNGFRYQCADKVLDVLCGTISEPFVHPSHDHPLYYIPQDGRRRQCSGCNELVNDALMCIEEGCDFLLDFKCATLPLVVHHSIDDDRPFSLCFGKEASGRDWCDICGKESDLKTWFYTSKDQQDSLHTNCVVGDFSGLMPTSTIEVSNTSFEVVLNNSVSRPFCRWCKSHCMYPIMLKMLGTSNTYVCSTVCLYHVIHQHSG